MAQDLAMDVADAASTRFRAIALDNVTEHAVLRARHLVAQAAFRRGTARLAAIGGVDRDGSVANLETSATRARARVPLTEGCHYAVGRARVCLALRLIIEGRADRAAVLRNGRNGTRTPALARAARSIALAPARPLCHGAVHIARVRVARHGLRQVLAHRTSMVRLAEH